MSPKFCEEPTKEKLGFASRLFLLTNAKAAVLSSASAHLFNAPASRSGKKHFSTLTRHKK